MARTIAGIEALIKGEPECLFGARYTPYGTNTMNDILAWIDDKQERAEIRENLLQHDRAELRLGIVIKRPLKGKKS